MSFNLKVAIISEEMIKASGLEVVRLLSWSDKSGWSTTHPDQQVLYRPWARL